VRWRRRSAAHFARRKGGPYDWRRQLQRHVRQEPARPTLRRNAGARIHSPKYADQWLTLNELQGRPVILAFYPADWSPVCGDQMTLYNEMLDEF